MTKYNHDTPEIKAIRDTIDLIERKKFFGLSKSEKGKLDYAAVMLRKYLPQQVALENKYTFCPKCSTVLPFDNSDVFDVYCTYCGQHLYNDGGK